MALKIIFFYVGEKLCVCVGRGMQQGRKNESCMAFEVRRKLAVWDSFPELLGRAEGRGSSASRCHQCHHRGVCITLSSCKCSLGCQPFLEKVSQNVSKPSPCCHCCQCCCLSLFVVLFFVMESSYLNLFWLAAALLEKGSRPYSLSDVLSVLLFFGVLHFFFL